MLFFALSLSSCYSGTIWHVKQADFQQHLQAGQYAFLKDIDYSKVNLLDVMHLGANAPFYMSFVFKQLDMNELSRQFLKIEWQRGSGIWQHEAARLLIAGYLAEHDYTDAEEMAKRAFSTYPDREFYRLLIESWYWQHKDENVLAGLARIKTMPGADGKPVQDDELALYEAVSSERLAKPGWQRLFMDLSTGQAASDYHVRAYDFLNLPENSTALASFTPSQRSLMSAKYDIAKREYGPALTQLAQLVADKDPLLMTPSDLVDLGKAYMGSRSSYAGAQTFDGFIPSLLANGGSSESLYAAYSTDGLLYRYAGYPQAAIAAFKRAIGYAGGDREYDRMAWYIIDTTVSLSPVGAIPVVAQYSRLWHDRSYFDDVLAELCTDLVEQRAWRGMWELYHDIDGYVDGETLARYAFVTSAAIRAGYIAIPDASATEHDLLQKVMDLDADPYYSILAAARLGRTPALLVVKNDPATAQVAAPGENTDWENLVIGFLSYGLYHDAYASARKRLSSMGSPFLHTLAVELSRRGDTLESMRIMDELEARPAYSMTPEDLKLLYPQPFDSLISDTAKKEGLPLSVFYAMVRVESYFDPTIVSNAGAVGLAQLMPATGADYGRRLGMKNPDLTNPDVNLTIGARYLKWLVDRFHDVGDALFAYNAGYTRVERWRERYGNLPNELFLEAVPYVETRGYGKKILVSAVVYGDLYFGISPDEVIREILPAF